MEYLRRVFLFTFLCGSVLFASCTRDEIEETSSLTFCVSPQNIGAFSATLVITHNGTNRDAYYGILVKGHGIDSDDRIREFMSTTSVSPIDVMYQRKKQIKLDDLSMSTDYTYIIFALVFYDGKFAYNDIFASYEFSTCQSEFVASENPNWITSCQGEAFYEGGYYSKITVLAENNESEHYFLKACKVDEPTNFSHMEDFLAHAVTTFQSEHENNEDDFWLEYHLLSNHSSNFYYVLDTGDYMAYAIGVNSDGTPTGHYAKSEPFHVREYTMSPGYANMLGIWTVTDSTGKTFSIQFSKHTSNRILTVSGWGGYSFKFLVKFRQSNGRLFFYRQNVAEEVIVTFIGVQRTGTLDLEGWWYSGGYHLTENVTTIAIGDKNASNNYSLSSAFHVGSGIHDYPMGMTYYFHNDEYRTLISPAFMTFPITMQKM